MSLKIHLDHFLAALSRIAKTLPFFAHPRLPPVPLSTPRRRSSGTGWFLAGLILWVFFVWGMGGRDAADAFRPEVLESQSTLKNFLAKQNIRSIEDYGRWLAQHLRYIADNDGDQWTDPLLTVQKGGGDCEDLAFLSQAVAREFGYPAKVFALIHGKKGHAFCVIPKDGRMTIFDNTNQYQVSVPSLKRLALIGLAKEKADALVELDQPTGVTPLLAIRRARLMASPEFISRLN